MSASARRSLRDQLHFSACFNLLQTSLFSISHTTPSVTCQRCVSTSILVGPSSVVNADSWWVALASPTKPAKRLRGQRAPAAGNWGGGGAPPAAARADTTPAHTMRAPPVGPGGPRTPPLDLLLGPPPGVAWPFAATTPSGGRLRPSAAAATGGTERSEQTVSTPGQQRVWLPLLLSLAPSPPSSSSPLPPALPRLPAPPSHAAIRPSNLGTADRHRWRLRQGRRRQTANGGGRPMLDPPPALPTAAVHGWGTPRWCGLPRIGRHLPQWGGGVAPPPYRVPCARGRQHQHTGGGARSNRGDDRPPRPAWRTPPPPPRHRLGREPPPGSAATCHPPSPSPADTFLEVRHR